MNQNDMHGVLALDPEDLDGHSVEELSDYLDAGRLPANRSIDESASCQNALDALERLHNLTPALLAADLAAEPALDEAWVQSIIGNIALDARAGRRIPIEIALPDSDAGITEAAVRGLIRSAETAVPGALLGKCTLEGDVLDPQALTRVRVDVSVPYGAEIPPIVDALRSEITSRLAAHTTLRLGGVDITVQDIRYAPAPAEEKQ